MSILERGEVRGGGGGRAWASAPDTELRFLPGKAAADSFSSLAIKASTSSALGSTRSEGVASRVAGAAGAAGSAAPAARVNGAAAPPVATSVRSSQRGAMALVTNGASSRSHLSRVRNGRARTVGISQGAPRAATHHSRDWCVAHRACEGARSSASSCGSCCSSIDSSSSMPPSPSAPPSTRAVSSNPAPPPRATSRAHRPNVPRASSRRPSATWTA
jgi:hypothetical protein